MEDDVLWEKESKRLSSDEELLMSYKKPTQPGPTDGRHNRHNEEQSNINQLFNICKC
jgi:hypothetical protein